MNKACFFALVATPLVAMPMIAIAGEPVDNYGAVAIANGDLRAAEAELTRRLAVAPRDVSAMLNLAMIYRKSGRTAEADALYTRVLEREDMLLDAANGSTVWAHDLARAKRGASLAIATR